MILAGYFARRIKPKPHHLFAPGVREICSVSECMSPGHDDWIKIWRHNSLGWFNTVSDAIGVVPEAERGEYRLFAYRIHPEAFRGRERLALTLPDDVRPEALPAGFRSIGFDSASRSSDAGVSMECSPLSCNGMASEMPANEHCLFATFDDAVAGAVHFAVEQPEPGDYYVVEVLEGPLRIEPSLSANAERAIT